MGKAHTFTGSYVLNALDEAELARFETHLVSCQICQDQVAEFRETVAEVSLLSLATPPHVLRNKILVAIRTTRQARSG
jgi:hypothetical protein